MAVSDRRRRLIGHLEEGLRAARAAQSQANKALHFLSVALHLLDPNHPEFEPESRDTFDFSPRPPTPKD